MWLTHTEARPLRVIKVFEATRNGLPPSLSKPPLCSVNKIVDSWGVEFSISSCADRPPGSSVVF